MLSTNKRATESFLVARQGQTALPSSGTLNNTSTTNVNLANGQLGFVSDSIFGSVAMNAFVDASPTITEAPIIAIYQGNENSASMATATTKTSAFSAESSFSTLLLSSFPVLALLSSTLHT